MNRHNWALGWQQQHKQPNPFHFNCLQGSKQLYIGSHMPKNKFSMVHWTRIVSVWSLPQVIYADCSQLTPTNRPRGHIRAGTTCLVTTCSIIAGLIPIAYHIDMPCHTLHSVRLVESISYHWQENLLGTWACLCVYQVAFNEQSDLYIFSMVMLCRSRSTTAPWRSINLAVPLARKRSRVSLGARACVPALPLRLLTSKCGSLPATVRLISCGMHPGQYDRPVHTCVHTTTLQANCDAQ